MSASLLRLPALSRQLGFPQVAPVRHLPPCRTIELPGRGKTYVADSGPVTDRPTFLLLHSVACTGLMTWHPALEMMRGYGRVIVFDQRWHGHGIHAPGFALEACADDAAALADALGVQRFVAVGYSMGSLVAQLVWHRHRQLVDGLVLCAGAATFARAKYERLAMRMFATAIEALSPRPGLPTVPPSAPASRARHDREWLWDQFRSTDPFAVTAAIAECAKFDSRTWVSEIDVPTSVVITLRDWVISPDRQKRLARRIPGAHVVTADVGHAGCTLQADRFVPALRQGVDSVCRRISSATT